MLKLPIPLRALLLAAVLSSTATSFTIPSIFERQSTCAASGQSACPPGVPSNFCCQTGQTCIPLAGNTTVLCCPGPQEQCADIVPIPCNVSLMNAALNPDSNVKTTALTSKLATCGDGCCPFGFSCNGGKCSMDKNQSALPAGASKPTTSAPATTGAPTSVPPASQTSAVTTEAPAAGPEQPKDGGSGQAFPTTAVIVGTIVGVLGGAALTGALLFFCYRRRRRGAATAASRGSGHGHGSSGIKMHRHNTSTSSFGNIISDPIMHENSAFRSDFILKTPSTQGGGASARNSPTRTAAQNGRLSTMFSQRHSTASQDHAGPSPTTYTPVVPGFGAASALPAAKTIVPPIRAMRNSAHGGYKYGSAPQPVTPRLQREPSSESINVFADPSTVGRSNSREQRRLTSATTFTDLMEEADMGAVLRGHAYVPHSAQSTPARR